MRKGVINIFNKRVKLLMTSLLTSPKAQTSQQILYRGDISKRPPAGEKPLRNSIELVMTGPAQPPPLHAPSKLLVDMPRRANQSHYDPSIFKITSRNLMHPFFSNPIGYHQQTIQKRAHDPQRVVDIKEKLKKKNPIQPLKNFNEEFERGSKVDPSNNSAYGNFYSGQYQYGFFLKPENMQITADSFYPGYEEEERAPSTFEELLRAKGKTYLNTKRTSMSPTGFEQTANRTLGSRGWKAKREHDNHSFLTTNFRHPNHLPYNTGGSDLQGKNYIPEKGVETIEDVRESMRRSNGWESPVGKKRGFSNMTKFKRDLERNKIQTGWKMSTYRNDVKGF